MLLYINRIVIWSHESHKEDFIHIIKKNSNRYCSLPKKRKAIKIPYVLAYFMNSILPWPSIYKRQ